MIVAFESASPHLSLALADARGEPFAEDEWISVQRQSAELLPRLLALLARSARTPDELSAVAVGSGPGSFTGLRVAMSVAKGFAIALRIPLVAVPSLAAWLEAAPDADAALVRAGAREAHLLGRADETVRVVDAAAAGALTGRLVAPSELAQAFGLSGTSPPRGAARAIARIASERLAGDPAGDDLARAEPLYVHAPRGIDAAKVAVASWR